MDGDAAYLAADDLDFTHVNGDPDLDLERLERLEDRPGTVDRLRRTLEHDEEAVAGRIELAPRETLQLAPHDRVVALEQLPPATVAQLARQLRGAHYVSEHHRREQTIWFLAAPSTHHRAQSARRRCAAQ